MALWRLVTRALYDLDRPATNRQIQDAADMDRYTVSSGLEAAQRWGLVTAKRVGTKADTLYSLTDMGRAYVEGRVRQEETRPDGRPGGRRWVATWLESLPRGLRIAPDAGH